MTRRAVILAGGKGSRLGPYTTVLPKPLLPVGDRAILDVVVHQLRDCGFKDLTLAVGYLAHLVRAVMGDGSRHGVRIGYHEEAEPLGTVGPLADDRRPRRHLPGDERRRADRARLRAARGHAPRDRQRADDRVAPARGPHRVRRPALGRPERRDTRERRPASRRSPRSRTSSAWASTCSSPRALDYIEQGEYLDLPDLVLRLLDEGAPGRAPTCTTATGSTSDATRTTRRR